MKTKKLKRIFIFVLIALVCQFVSAAPTGQRLKDLVNSSELLIGSITRSSFQSVDSGNYVRVLNEEFNFVTCENAMKIDATEPSQNSFNFNEGDQTVNWALSNGYKVHGHTLVWHSQMPGWMSSITDRTQLTNAMNNHIDKVMGHWKGKIHVWDVVNEAFNEDGSYRSSPWTRVIGNNFIDLAFQRARQADPDAKLIYNDYNLAAISAKSTAAYNMAQSMIQRGIPIDGVGFQMHLTESGLNYQSFADNMARFAALGLEIYITEMDVRMPDSNRDLQKQATIYREVLQRCIEQPACKGFQVWGIVDKYSWCMSTFPGTGVPLLFDDNYNAKPAYYAVQEVLAEGSTTTPGPTDVPTTVPTAGPTPIPGTISIACGSSSDVGDFTADQYFSGGSTYNNSNTVNVSQVDAPAALFNNERYGEMTYTIPGFTSGSSYKVTLYFAETYLTSSGSRVFNVSINSTAALSNFDIFADAGGQDIATSREFTATANSSGQIVIQFTPVTENPKINGISIEPGSGPTTAPTATPVTTPTPTPGDCNVSFDPQNSTQQLNSSFQINVVVDSGNQELAAYGFTISYDANILSVVDVEEGADGFLAAANTTNPGEIIASGFDASGTGPGSNLQVLIITFDAIAEGTSTLGVDVDQLVDAGTNPIGTACGNNGSVEVSDTGMLGDTNGDGVIDIVDALITAQYYVDLDPANFIPGNADTNCDGAIDIVDALLIAQYYVDLITGFCLN